MIAVHKNFLLYTSDNIDNISISVGHLDHVFLTVYSSMKHVTWKSLGPMCGWVCRIPRPHTCISESSRSEVPLLAIWFVALPLYWPLLPCPNRWRGSLPQHGLWWLTCELHYSPLLCREIWVYVPAVTAHFFLVLLDPQTKLPACLPNIWAEPVLAKDMVDQFGRLLIFDLVLWIVISRSRAPSSCKQSKRYDQDIWRTSKRSQ